MFGKYCEKSEGWLGKPLEHTGEHADRGEVLVEGDMLFVSVIQG